MPMSLVSEVDIDTTKINMFVGDADNQVVSGTYNMGVGHYALIANTTGTKNVAIGAQALYVNTTGIENLAIGVEALAANNGSRNTAVGAYDAMLLNTTGSDNVAVGDTVMYSNTTGNRSTAVGKNALYENATGDENVAVGGNAAYTSKATGNTAVGFNAGYDLSTGAGNIMLGYKARNVTTGSRNIVIGSEIYAVQPAESSQLNIGNAIFGRSLTGTLYDVPDTARIGILDFYAGSSLSVKGNVSIGTTTFSRAAGNSNGLSVEGRIGAGVLVSTAAVDVVASTTTVASLRLRPGVAPTAPNDGDMWVTSAGLFVRINGATVGPLS